MTSVLLLSAPVEAKEYASSYVSYRAYRSFQTMFGFDAQLRLFAETARRAGCRPLFVPAPENFFLPQTYRRLLEIAGASARRPEDLLHVRFGPIRTQRVAKGTTNLALIAEDPAGVPLNLGRHPFASGDTLPASTARALVYDPAHGPYRTLPGQVIPTTPLPDVFIAGDLDYDPSDSVVDDEAGIASDITIPSSLHVQSLAEFAPPDWIPVADGRSHAASVDFRRVLIDRELRARGPRAHGDLVIVPWNLAHLGSAIPDLLAKLARFYAPESVACRPVLFPYNMTTSSTEQLIDGVNRLRGEFERSKLTTSGILIARVTNPRDIRRLPELFPFAWIDGTDPERAWLLRRLAAIGIGTALIRSPFDRRPSPATGSTFEIPSDDQLIINVRDGFGTRIFSSSTLSARGLSDLVKRSAAEIERRRGLPALGIPPAAIEAPQQAFYDSLRGPADTVAHAAE